MSIYNRFYVELDIREKIYGTLPGNREIFEGWMQAKFEDSENVENTAKDLDLDKEIEKNTNQFRCDEIGIYMGSYQIKAMIGQCANLLGFTMDKRGSKQTVKEGSFIKGINADGDFTGEKVYLLPLRTEADGKDNFTGNVSGPQGSRSIISNSQFCQQVKLRFQLTILANRMQDDRRGKKLNIEDFEFIFEHGQEVGLGAHRNMEAGKFDVVKFCAWEDYQDSIAAG